MPTSDTFTRRYNPFEHYFVLSMVVAAFGFRLEWQLPVLAILAAVTVSSSRRKKIYRGFLKFVLPLILIGYGVNGLFFTGKTAFAFGPLNFKTDGLLFATRVAVRLILIVVSMGYYFSRVKPETIYEYLVTRGVDRRFVYIYLLSVAMVHLMRDRLRKIYIAQSARGMDTGRNVITRVRYLLPLLVPLSYSYISESLDRGTAMRAAGFSGRSPSGSKLSPLLEVEVDRKGLLAGRILLAAVSGAVIWRFFG